MKTKFVHGCQLHSAIYHSSLVYMPIYSEGTFSLQIPIISCSSINLVGRGVRGCGLWGRGGRQKNMGCLIIFSEWQDDAEPVKWPDPGAKKMQFGCESKINKQSETFNSFHEIELYIKLNVKHTSLENVIFIPIYHETYYYLPLYYMDVS